MHQLPELRRWRTLAALALVALLAGSACDRDKTDSGKSTSPDKAQTSSPTPKEPPEPPGPDAGAELDATYRDQPLHVRSAIAYASAEGWYVDASTEPLSCTQDTFRQIAADEVSFTIEVHPVLAPDGTRTLRPIYTYFSGMNVTGARVEGSVEALDVTDDLVTITFGPTTIKAMGDDPAIQLAGPLVARRCPKPRRPPPDDLYEAPASLVMVIADLRFPIRGALVNERTRSDGTTDRTLTLSTDPLSCKSPGDGAIQLDLELTPTTTTARYAYLRGKFLDSHLSESNPDFTLEETPGQGTSTFTITGTTDIVSYPITFEGGPLTARVCAP